MKKKIFIIVAVLFVLNNIKGQTIQINEQRKCGFVSNKQNMVEINKERKVLDKVLTIPVHVIVVHLSTESVGQGRNLSEAQILSQFPVLNQDFRRLNPDTNNTPAEFQSIAADCMIEFCLADIDPDGNPTNGITRYVYDGTVVQENYLDQTIKPATFWDPTHYLNIWTARIFDDGYAYMPSDGVPPYMDGVVCKDIYFGTIGTASPPFNLGHMATHEIGHWLGLHHTWGPFSGCTIGDGVDDTPDQQNFYYGCPSYPQSSCGTNDMFMNYMDYADDVCLNVFTEGQKERIHQTIIDGRPELLNPHGCSFLMGEQTLEKKERINIYPNPSTQFIIIEKHFEEEIELKVYNIQAELIHKNFINQKNKTINVSDFENGIYFFSFFNDKRHVTNKKVIINH